MRSSRKLVFLAACLAMSAGGFSADAKKEKKDADRKKEAAKKNAKKPVADAKEKPPTEPQIMPVPVPVGHDAKGVKLPTFWPDGQTLKMVFNIGLGTQIGRAHV